jgi:hypothetical protein
LKRKRTTRKVNASRLSVPERHQLKIARDTLRMPDAMVGVMGGMTKVQAREIFRRLMAKARGVRSNPRRRKRKNSVTWGRKHNQRAGETITVRGKKFTIHAASDDGSSPNLQRELAAKGIRRQLFATPAKGGTRWVINQLADGSLGKPRKLNPRRKNESPQEIIRAFGAHRFPKTGTVVDSIHAGDRVTIVNRFGQKSTGRAVMPSSNGGWVLNLGGAHGTPGIATAENIVKVMKRKNSKRNTVAWGVGDQRFVHLALKQLFPGKAINKLTSVQLSQVMKLAQQLKTGKKNPVRKVAGGWDRCSQHSVMPRSTRRACGIPRRTRGDCRTTAKAICSTSTARIARRRMP